MSKNNERIARLERDKTILISILAESNCPGGEEPFDTGCLLTEQQQGAVRLNKCQICWRVYLEPKKHQQGIRNIGREIKQ